LYASLESSLDRGVQLVGELALVSRLDDAPLAKKPAFDIPERARIGATSMTAAQGSMVGVPVEHGLGLSSDHWYSFQNTNPQSMVHT
jgi:hypothetical protein